MCVPYRSLKHMTVCRDLLANTSALSLILNIAMKWPYENKSKSIGGQYTQYYDTYEY